MPHESTVEHTEQFNDDESMGGVCARDKRTWSNEAMNGEPKVNQLTMDSSCHNMDDDMSSDEGSPVHKLAENGLC